MSIDIEQVVADSMRARGEGQVDVLALRQATMARAVSRHRRRRLVAAAGVAAVVSAGLLALPGSFPGGPADVTGDASPGPSLAPGVVGGPPDTLPVADAPAAARRPESVGTDPAVLHFDVDLVAAEGIGVSWRSVPGVEEAAVWAPDLHGYGKRAEISLASDLDALLARYGGQGSHAVDRAAARSVSVGGRPGKIQSVENGWRPDRPTRFLWWSPVDRLWVLVAMPAFDDDNVLAMAQAVRLDRAQRCVLPVRLTAVPPDARWTGCDLMLGARDPAGRSWEVGNVQFTHPRGGTVTVGVGNYEEDTPFVANRTVSGQPAMWHFRDLRWILWVPRRDNVNLLVRVYGDGFTEADALLIANGLVLSDDVTDPAAWPARPVP